MVTASSATADPANTQLSFLMFQKVSVGMGIPNYHERAGVREPSVLIFTNRPGTIKQGQTRLKHAPPWQNFVSREICAVAHTTDCRPNSAESNARSSVDTMPGGFSSGVFACMLILVEESV